MRAADRGSDFRQLRARAGAISCASVDQARDGALECRWKRDRHTASYTNEKTSCLGRRWDIERRKLHLASGIRAQRTEPLPNCGFQSAIGAHPHRLEQFFLKILFLTFYFR